MKQYLKFVVYVITAATVLTYSLIYSRSYEDHGRYQFQTFEDGEIVRYDTATGRARTIHHGKLPDTFKFDDSNTRKVLPPEQLEGRWPSWSEPVEGVHSLTNERGHVTIKGGQQ